MAKQRDKYTPPAGNIVHVKSEYQDIAVNLEEWIQENILASHLNEGLQKKYVLPYFY